MKIILILCLLIMLPSCSTLIDWTNANSINQEKEERQRQEQIREKQDSIHAGSTIEEVKDAWGEPDTIDYMDGEYTYHYPDQEDPMIFVFREDKLVGWKHDTDAKKLNEISYQNQQTHEELKKQSLINTLNSISSDQKINQIQQNTQPTHYQGSRVNIYRPQ